MILLVGILGIRLRFRFTVPEPERYPDAWFRMRCDLFTSFHTRTGFVPHISPERLPDPPTPIHSGHARFPDFNVT